MTRADIRILDYEFGVSIRMRRGQIAYVYKRYAGRGTAYYGVSASMLRLFDLDEGRRLIEYTVRKLDESAATV